LKILVTGGTGFLGAAVTRRLVAVGEGVRVLVRGSGANVLAGLEGVELVQGDLRDASSLQRALEGVQAVCHCAARVAVGGPWSAFEEVTVRGTEHVLEAAVTHHVGLFLHVSSLGVYGPEGQTTINEDSPFDHDPEGQGFYSRSKMVSERLVWRYAEQHALPVCVIRPGILYGPSRPVYLPRLRFSISGRLLVVIGPRQQYVPLAHVDNVAAAILLALHSPQAVGKSYNLVDSETVCLKDYLALLQRLGHIPARTLVIPPAPFYPVVRAIEAFSGLMGRSAPVSRRQLDRVFASRRFDTTRARRELGWQPEISLEQGLRGLQDTGR
jgi:nucleoside-diphosphate-sugar epimerase